jgi:hypothetical protein
MDGVRTIIDSPVDKCFSNMGLYKLGGGAAVFGKVGDATSFLRNVLESNS